MNEKQKKLSVMGICHTLGLMSVAQKDIDDVFKIMCWSSTNEVHVFSFAAFMFLFKEGTIPYYYLCDYPEKTVRVINTITTHKTTFSLTDLLYLEYGENDVQAENDYLVLLVNFTLFFINRWTAEINPDFKIEHNLIVPDLSAKKVRDS